MQFGRVGKLFKQTKGTIGEANMEPQYEKVGRITHFYTKPSVAVVELSATLSKGDKIVIRGSTTNVEQAVDSIEIEHKQIPTAQSGQSIGMKVLGRVRENDIVYRVKSTP
jgi:translation elongation factor EF-Tu-like GTPase